MTTRLARKDYEWASCAPPFHHDASSMPRETHPLAGGLERRPRDRLCARACACVGGKRLGGACVFLWAAGGWLAETRRWVQVRDDATRAAE